ncbi:hypothetical protein LVD17_12955 [Fulvivirga ulvae]|uniref:hypothetical protein n=1 Tax=Fulvivirga ulvae TaxID=2904245 RepID=UPI001F219B60|nr:hypothetical protein [Fulvivirga ulvae]UII34718.1 hypothetical protein LVD17_12955 [Fulvivirga ulvae]
MAALKRNRLTKSLSRLGLDDGGLYDLDILTIISQLMGIQDDKLSDTFSDIYIHFINEGDQVTTFELEGKISLIATQCYEMLKTLVEIEILLGRI